MKIEKKQLIAERKLLIKILREQTRLFIKNISNPTKIETAEAINKYGYVPSGSIIKQLVDDLERNRKDLY